MLVPVLLVVHRRGSGGRLVPQLDRRDWMLVLGIAAVGTVGFTVFLLYGLRSAPGAVAAVVMATTPAVTAVGAVPVLRDRLDRWTGAGIVLAMVGVVAVNVRGGAEPVTPGRSGRCWASPRCAARPPTRCWAKTHRGPVPILAIATLAAVLAGLMFPPFAVVQAAGLDWSAPTWTDWLAVLWWGRRAWGLAQCCGSAA